MASWWKKATVGNAIDLCEEKIRKEEGLTVSPRWLVAALRRLAKVAGEEWKPMRKEGEGGVFSKGMDAT